MPTETPTETPFDVVGDSCDDPIDATGGLNFVGDISDYSRVHRATGCSPFDSYGRDLVFSVDLLLGETLTATSYSTDFIDLVAWLTESCGDPLTCLDSDDSSFAAEEVTFTAPSDITVYVHVAAYSSSTSLGNVTVDIVVEGAPTPTPTPEPVVSLFFSEYIEGSSNNKAFEVHNAGPESIALDRVEVVQGNNGGNFADSTQRNVLDPSGEESLQPGEVFVVCNGASVQEILNVCDLIIPQLGPTLTSFNGDDSLGLFLDGALVDIIGEEGVDPGTAYTVAGVSDGTQNHTLLRRPSVSAGNPDWSSSAGTNTDDTEWDLMPSNTFEFLGAHPGRSVPERPGEVCVTALDLQLGSVQTGDSSAFADNYQPDSSCTGAALPGVDVVYQVHLTRGVTYAALMYSAHDGAIWVADDCGDLANSCLAGTDAVGADDIEYIEFTAPGSGTYYIVVDAPSANQSGYFEVLVTPI